VADSAAAPSAFWGDLLDDLKDPNFLRAYVMESLRIETIDRLVNELDLARQANGLSKAELARATRSEPAVVRRLLSRGHRNPTVGTLVDVAAALGLKVELVPMSSEERDRLVGPLQSGVTADPKALARDLELRRSPVNK
jgi:DNA-binding phage protein